MRSGENHSGSAVFFVLFIFVSVFFSDLYGLDPRFGITQYGHLEWNEENGLPQNSVHAIAQTRDGHIWLGTEEGLVRFDGERFHVYNRLNTADLGSNYIHCLLADQSGNLWIGSKQGLLLYRDRAFEKVPQLESLDTLFIYDLEEHDQTGLWIASDGGGLFNFNAGRLRVITTENGLASNVVRSINRIGGDQMAVGTANGITWIGTDGGILPETDKDLLRGMNVYRVIKDRQDRFWAGCDDGLFLAQNGRWIRNRLPETLPTEIVTDLLLDRDGSLWIGTAGGGLLRWNAGGYELIDRQRSLADDWVNTLFEDREGSLWVGTAFGGVSMLHEVKIMTFSRSEGLPDDVVFAVYEDGKERIWIGTNSGLACLQDGAMRVVTTEDGLSNNTVNAIAEDRSGQLWVATDNGLNRLYMEPSGQVTCKRFLPGHMFLAAMVDSRGTLWLGSNRGVYRSQNGRFTLLDPEQYFGVRVANFFFEDHDGALWISAYRIGLIRVSEDGARLFTDRDGLADTATMAIHQDREGILWVGTTEGLSIWTGDGFRSLHVADGLHSDTIYRILEDDRGGLWLSCNRGIYRILKRDVQDVLSGGKGVISSTVYGKADGMRSQECNGGIQPAGWRSRDGRLWFPTIKGVSVVDPGKMWRNDTSPPVVVGDILLDGQSVGFREVIRVEPGVKRLEFRFAALSYIDTERINYFYRLENFDDAWVDGGQQRRAFYTNLPAGHFSFQVKAINSDSVWSLKPAAVSLEVIPPFWRTWWFMIVALILFSLLSYTAINFLRRYVKLATFWKKEKYVGHFQVLDKIASGGMGTIYKARDLLDNSRVVAVKILRDEYFENEDMKKRFAQEAEIIHRLRHPNIIRVFERGEVKKTQYIAMEYLRGETLSHLLARQSRLDIPIAVHIVKQVAAALAFIHRENVIHRDLKPENIMLVHHRGDKYFVKLLDFGLARTQFQTRITQTGMVLGTIHYLSPEQVRESLSSKASDIYSLGIIMYEMLTARKPFPGDSTVAVMKRILEEVPTEPRRLNAQITTALNRLIMQMVAKDSEQRPIIDRVLEILDLEYSPSGGMRESN